MKLKSILSTTLVASLLLSCGRTGKNDQTDFNGNWAFHIVEDTLNYHIDYSATDFETDSWENVRLPHTANIEPRGERPVAGNMLVPQNLRHFKLQQREEIFHRV